MDDKTVAPRYHQCMIDLSDILLTLSLRAQWLVVIIPIAFVVGELVARGSFLTTIANAINARIAALGRKLDRTHRNAATRVYRGIITLFILLIPALVLGLALAQHQPWVEWLSLIVLIAAIGRSLATFHLARLGREAARGTLKLEIPGLSFLFADTHAVMRYAILTSARDFAVGVVGTSFWYLVGGMPLALAYLTLAAASRHTTTPAFGWAVRSVFQLLNFIPHAIAVALLALAGLFVVGGRPLAMRHAKHFHGAIAYLLGISLGGRLPNGELPWEGTGTAKVEPGHLLRWLLLRSVAMLLLMLLLAAPQIFILLKGA
jgi:cobalamin biosynthesis protein CobD/CbiB